VLAAAAYAPRRSCVDGSLLCYNGGECDADTHALCRCHGLYYGRDCSFVRQSARVCVCASDIGVCVHM
jgi:hypothetical protein